MPHTSSRYPKQAPPPIPPPFVNGMTVETEVLFHARNTARSLLLIQHGIARLPERLSLAHRSCDIAQAPHQMMSAIVWATSAGF